MKTGVKLAITLLAFSVIGTAIGIAASLPYQFGGIGDPARVSEEFVAKGTAISPPLVGLIVLALALVLAIQRGLVGRVGSGALALLGAASLIPSFGEVMGAGAFSGPVYVFVVVWDLIGIAIILGMIAFGAREALSRSQTA